MDPTTTPEAAVMLDNASNTPAIAEALRSLARTFRYPDRTYHLRVVACVEALAATGLEAAYESMREFSSMVAARTRSELEEGFTQTFDLNPKCAAEVGWHIFGEDYNRGSFMVEVRKLLREYGVPEDTELPDHLTHIALLLAAMVEQAGAGGSGRRETAEAMLRLIDEAAAPAIVMMIGEFEGTDSPYTPLMRATGELVAAALAHVDPNGASLRNGKVEVAHD